MNIEVYITTEGLDRIPDSKEGDRFAVKSITNGARGDYWCVHVLDGKGNVWTLGEGQWKPAGLKE